MVILSHCIVVRDVKKKKKLVVRWKKERERMGKINGKLTSFADKKIYMMTIEGLSSSFIVNTKCDEWDERETGKVINEWKIFQPLIL